MTHEKLGIVPLEYDDRIFIENLADSLHSALEVSLPASLTVETDVVRSLSLPFSAWNGRRRQYRAGSLLDAIISELTYFDKVLGVTDQDIFEPSMNFVFGVASIGKHAAVISLRRLHPSFSGKTEDVGVFFARAVKEAVHETGHLYWLPHCQDPRCVMHYSNSLPDTDRKSDMYCESCRSRLRERYG